MKNLYLYPVIYNFLFKYEQFIHYIVFKLKLSQGLKIKRIKYQLG